MCKQKAIITKSAFASCSSDDCQLDQLQRSKIKVIKRVIPKKTASLHFHQSKIFIQGVSPPITRDDAYAEARVFFSSLLAAL